MAFLVPVRVRNVELGPCLVEVGRQQFADRHADEAGTGNTGLVGLAASLEDRSLALDGFLDLQRPGVADEQVPVTRALAVGEEQHALLAQPVAAIAGQHMH